MAKSATKKKASAQRDLFDPPARAAQSRARRKPARGKPARGAEAGYTAKHIEVLEGLEPVRRRPGMYIGGTDEKALHHLFAEVIDNAMDEALAGHADWIEVEMEADGFVSVTDNGRGIPVDPHPKFKNKSALEVIMCTLHAGGKFDSKVYETSGGLHGVGVSVANALSERMEVEVAREQQLYRMAFERGKPKGKLEKAGRAPNRRGTKVRFRPDPQIFGPKAAFKPERVFKMTRSKAYLFGGVEIRWHCDKALLKGVDGRAREGDASTSPRASRTISPRASPARRWCIPTSSPARSGKTGRHGAAEWAVAWTADTDGFLNSYCNTIPTPDGGTHESGLRSALLRGLKDHAARVGQEKRAAPVTSDDIMTGAGCMLSVFIREPEFQGQTKDRLATAAAQKIVEQAIKDPFDHWLSANPAQANKLLDFVDRARRRAPPPPAGKGHRAQDRGAQAAPARQARRLQLIGLRRLGDFHRRGRLGRRLGQAGARPPPAGGAAAARQDPQRRLRRQGQAGAERPARRSDPGARLRHRRALSREGSALREGHHHDRRRRRRRAHRLAADHLLLPPDAEADRGRPALSRACRRSIRLSHGGKIVYARDDKHKDELLKKEFNANAKVEVSRFKGLGEMMAAQLKETTMDPAKRTLLRVMLADKELKPTAKSVEQLMGNKAESRFAFIQENAEFAKEELLDV